MSGCITVIKEVLTSPVMLRMEGGPLSWEGARKIADNKAQELGPNPPMLLAWYDRRSGRFSPPVECCSEQKPGWIVYAETRGGDITIDINDEDFVFIYRSFPEAEE